MELVRLWRYPVKSMQGEPLEHALVDGHGIVGDRRFAVLDRRRAATEGRTVMTADVGEAGVARASEQPE